MKKFFAKKTPCGHGHVHASKREARRCDELHQLESLGEIIGLQVEPKFSFVVDGKPVKMANGHTAQYKPDFTYIENGIKVAEDVKPSNGWQSRDVALRFALFRHLWPSIELRVVK